MRLRDTYNSKERFDMLLGKPISFLKYVFQPHDPFYNEISCIYNGYYMRSNNKRISPIFETFISEDLNSNPFEIEMLPYDIDNITGASIKNYSSNLSPFLIIEDFGNIVINSDMDSSFGSVNARWYCYDINGVYLGYVSNSFYNPLELKRKFSSAYYFRYQVIFVLTTSNVAWKPTYSMVNNKTGYINIDDAITHFNLTITTPRKTAYNVEMLGTLVRGTFIDKWERMYNALSLNYKVENSINLTTSSSGEITDRKTSNQDTTITKDENNIRIEDFDNRIDTDTLEFKDRNDQEHFNYKDDKKMNSKDINHSDTSTSKDNTNTLSFANRNDQYHENFQGTKSKAFMNGETEETTYGTNDVSTLSFNNRNDQEKETKGDVIEYTYGFNSDSEVAAGKTSYNPTGANAGHINRGITKYGSETTSTNKTGTDSVEKHVNGTDNDSEAYDKNHEVAKYGSEITTEVGSNNEKNDTEKQRWENNLDYGEKNKEVAKYGKEITTREKSGTEKISDENTSTERTQNSTSDTNVNDFSKQEYRTGNDIPVAELIKIELDLRDKNILISTIYSDIDSIITLPIY